MSEPRFSTVVVRFGGEIGIKANWTRKLYERRLITNIKAVLKKHGVQYARLFRKFGRFYIETVQAEKAAEKLSRVLGISSLSPAVETSSNLNDIIQASLDIAALRFRNGKSFAVRCHRIGKHPYSSQDVCRQVGQSILTKLSHLVLKVDLTHPEQTLYIEVREDKAYVFTDVVKGAGGLPLGTQSKVICLLKGDTSSAVACWMTMKRGCPAILVHVNEGNLGDIPGVAAARDMAKPLMEWAVGFPRNLYVIELGHNFQKLTTQKHPTELNRILCKRLMLRIAQSLATMKNAEGIVTGDWIGERASQTVREFRIQDEAAKDYPIYRPLLGLDENEIEELAHTIGLDRATRYELKSEKERTQTSTTPIELEDIKKIEKELNLEKMADKILESLKILKV